MRESPDSQIFCGICGTKHGKNEPHKTLAAKEFDEDDNRKSRRNFTVGLTKTKINQVNSKKLETIK